VATFYRLPEWLSISRRPRGLYRSLRVDAGRYGWGHVLKIHFLPETKRMAPALIGTPLSVLDPGEQK